MDEQRFDSLTRLFARGASRRTVIKTIFGFGGAAAAGSILQDTEAARRGAAVPTPTPHPSCDGVLCKDGCCDGQCTTTGACCPAGSTVCGPDCCPNDRAECCDNACCYGTCYGEELCCPTGYPVCSVDGCCHGVCVDGGRHCCHSANVCGDQCCTGTQHCCGDQCLASGQCCNDDDCDHGQCIDGTCTGDTQPNTTAGTDVEVALPDGTVSFPNVIQEGETTITPLANPPEPVPGEFTIDGAAFYDISTTAIVNGTVTICLPFDAGAFTNPSEVRLLHFELGHWVDITTSAPGSNPVCGQVNSLSPFAIAEPVPVECEEDYQCPSDSPNCRMNACINGVCGFRQANPGMICGSCSECNASGQCVQTCSQDEICCNVDGGFSQCCTEDLCNHNTGVCCDPGYSTCGPTCCRADQYCCRETVCSDSPCCEVDSDCPACHQCNVGFCEPLCDEYWEQCCPDLDEHGQCVPYNQSCSDPICDQDLCQILENGACVDACTTHGLVCDGQGACVPPCVALDGACGDGDTCCGDNVCCNGVCSTLDSTCGGACCGDDQDCCGGYYCVPKGATCCNGPVQCTGLNSCSGDGLKIWHSFSCPPSLGYCVESIQDCSNDDPCHPGVCAWDTGCWQDVRGGVPCGDQCCANCCNGTCIDENLTCCNNANDCPAVPNQIAGCSGDHICEYTSACPGCVGLWDNCDGLGGQSLTACDGCTPVICCYATGLGYQYPRWTPANLAPNSEYSCSA